MAGCRSFSQRIVHQHNHLQRAAELHFPLFLFPHQSSLPAGVLPVLYIDVKSRALSPVLHHFFFICNGFPLCRFFLSLFAGKISQYHRRLRETDSIIKSLQAYVVQHEGEGYVLVKDIEQLHGNVRAAALYNPSDSTCAFHVSLDLLELGGKVKVRDLVKQKDEKAIQEYLSYTLPPHSVKILRLEAEQRLEPTRYEAEWAYLPLYNDLGKQKRIISPQSFEGASGRMIVTHIGGSKDNYMEWSNVHSDKGGSYTLTIAYLPPEAGKREVNDRLIEVEVNGHVYAPIKKLAKNRSEGICTVSQPVRLEPGRNTIRLGSAYTWTPDIDCITLEPQS